VNEEICWHRLHSKGPQGNPANRSSELPKLLADA
jgi:hypothetical protein